MNLVNIQNHFEDFSINSIHLERPLIGDFEINFVIVVLIIALNHCKWKTTKKPVHRLGTIILSRFQPISLYVSHG